MNIDRFEITPGFGTAIRFGSVVAWADPAASPALISFLAQSVRNLGPSRRGGRQIADHIAAVLVNRDPEPAVGFAVIGPSDHGWATLLHGPVQVWDGSRWLYPPAEPGWIQAILTPKPVITVSAKGAATPSVEPNSLLDLEAGVVPGNGFVLIPAAPARPSKPPDVAAPRTRTTRPTPPEGGRETPTAVLAAAPSTALLETSPGRGASEQEERAPTRAQTEVKAEEPEPKVQVPAPEPKVQPATPQPGLASPDVAQPERVGPDRDQAKPGGAAAAEPHTAELHTAKADTAEPDTAEPGAAEADTAEPGAAEADTSEPDTAEAHTAEPGAAEPGAAEPGAAEADTAEPDTAEAHTAEPGAAEPGAAESSVGVPHTAEPDPSVADTAEPELADPEPAPAPPPRPVTPGPAGSLDLRTAAAPPRAPLPPMGSASSGLAGAPVVAGVACRRGHFNRLGLSTCVRCGTDIPADTDAVSGSRPPLGTLVLDNGTIFRIDRPYLVGSHPGRDPSVSGGLARPLALAGGDVSGTHAELRLHDWDVMLVDRGSATGTSVFEPGASGWVRLNAFEPRVVPPGTHMAFGQRIVTFIGPWARAAS